MTEEQGYNGWKNYETWVMALWIDNDQGTYTYSRELVREAGAVCANCGDDIEEVDGIWVHVDGRRTVCATSEPTEMDVARPSMVSAGDALKAWQEDMMPELSASVWSDLLSAAFSEVDWYEIAENFLSE